MDNQKIGAFIAARRKEMGLTQQQLAERLGVTNKAVSKWESGNGIPDISLFTALAEVLGVTADELLRGEPSGSPAQEEAGPSGGEEPEDTEVTRAFELPENAEATRAFVLPEEHTSGETGPLEEAEAGGKASKRRRLVPLWAWIAGGVVLAVALAIGIGAFCLAGLSGTPVSGPSDPSGGASASSGLFTGALTEAETTTAAETTASSATSAPTTTTTTTTTTTRTTTGTTVPLRPPLPNGASAEALTASAVLLYDASAGQTLYAYADTVQRDPASMTKLMTAIVALQYADVDTAHYVVGSEQALVKKPDSSMAYLEQGWDMPLKALIHAMLLPSGCDNAKTLTHLMELSHQILDDHPINQTRRTEGKLPANGVWFWAEGTGVALGSFVDKYGKNGTVISAVPLCQGIARLGSLKAVEVEGATGELDTNYEGKTQAALDCLADGDDFVAIHVEAPDECTHNGDTPGKLQAIEWLSSRVVGPLVEGMDKAGYDYRILILSDHKTLTSTRGHDGDPVPYLIYDSRTDTHNDLPYTEEAGLKGPFMDNGVNLMAALFEQD